MSFSSTVKEEIIGCVLNKEKGKACLYGMLAFCKAFSEKQILLQTENPMVAERFCLLLSEVIKDETAIRQSVVTKKGYAELYSLTIDDPYYIKIVFDYLGIDPSIKDRSIDNKVVGKKKNISFFVSGAFLVCGSVNDPLKEYHLEFVTSSKVSSEQLCRILNENGIMAKTAERKKSFIVYIKESENIEDMLTYMGAPKSSLELMNVKILKDVRNKINRAVNCDNANIEKTLKASEKQVESIELIDEKMGIDNLPEELRDIAILRLENPDWNLKELAEGLNPPISRSGANHRLARIIKIAEGLKG